MSLHQLIRKYSIILIAILAVGEGFGYFSEFYLNEQEWFNGPVASHLAYSISIIILNVPVAILILLDLRKYNPKSQYVAVLTVFSIPLGVIMLFVVTFLGQDHRLFNNGWKKKSEELREGEEG